MKLIRVLLVGRTGHGKSSVGNTLLGRQEFAVSDESQSCTQTCTFGERECSQNDIRLVVVDTPGIFDTNLPKLQIMKELLKTVVYTTPGFHIIAFVLRPDRFTQELQETQQLFFEWFGGNVRDYACLIMTNCSSQEDVQRYIRNPPPSLQALIQGCNDTIIPFENTGPPDLKQKQVQHFLDQALNIQANNDEQCFSNLAFYIATEYAKNRDLNSITKESLRILEEGGARFMRDSMQSLKLLEETNEKGNLKIIIEEGTETSGADVVTSYGQDASIPLVNFAADFETSLDVSSPPRRQRPSSRANRVFVHPESDTDNNAAERTPLAPSRPAEASTESGQSGSMHDREGSDYGAIPKTKGNSRFMHREGVAPSRNVAEEKRDMSSTRAQLYVASDDFFRGFRNDMRDEENVNKFIECFRWIKGKLTQFINYVKRKLSNNP